MDFSHLSNISALGWSWVPLGQGMRVPHLAAKPSWLPFCVQLAVQCASWTRRCALGAPPLCSSESSLRPPSTSIYLHLHLSQRRNRTTRGERISVRVIVTEPLRSSQTSLLSRRRLSSIGPGGASRSSARPPAAPLRSAPRRAGQLRSLSPRRAVNSQEAGWIIGQFGKSARRQLRICLLAPSREDNTQPEL